MHIYCNKLQCYTIIYSLFKANNWHNYKHIDEKSLFCIWVTSMLSKKSKQRLIAMLLTKDICLNSLLPELLITYNSQDNIICK
jgi:hypothetical protein